MLDYDAQRDDILESARDSGDWGGMRDQFETMYEGINENLNAFMDQIVRAKPSAAKGTYVKSVTVSSTMGPGVSIDPNLYRRG